MTTDAAMRVVVVSQYETALAGMIRVCRSNGHVPVAAICARAESPRSGRISPDAVALATAVMSSCPSGICVSVVDGLDQFRDLIARYAPDLLLVRGFRWRLPPDVLAIAKYGSVNLHPSCLPQLRGPFPVHWAIRDGDRTLGVTAHRMDENFDTGPVLATAYFDVEPNDFGDVIWQRVDEAAERALATALDRLARGESGDVQDESKATWAGTFEQSEAAVDWTRTAEQVHNQVRAFSLGYLEPAAPVAELNGQRVQLSKTSLTAIDAPSVACRDRPIWLAEYTALD